MAVQTVATLLGDSEAAVSEASSIIAPIQVSYLQGLQSINQIQIGECKFSYYNPESEQTETIDNHFFNEAQVQEALKLGQDMNLSS